MPAVTDWGYTPYCPCPCRYTEIMMSCWSADPNERPSFTDVRDSLDRLFHGRPGDEYYYGPPGNDGTEALYDETR